jgi:hypothetical protein
LLKSADKEQSTKTGRLLPCINFHQSFRRQEAFAAYPRFAAVFHAPLDEWEGRLKYDLDYNGTYVFVLKNVKFLS